MTYTVGMFELVDGVLEPLPNARDCEAIDDGLQALRPDILDRILPLVADGAEDLLRLSNWQEITYATGRPGWALKIDAIQRAYYVVEVSPGEIVGDWTWVGHEVGWQALHDPATPGTDVAVAEPLHWPTPGVMEWEGIRPDVYETPDWETLGDMALVDAALKFSPLPVAPTIQLVDPTGQFHPVPLNHQWSADEVSLALRIVQERMDAGVAYLAAIEVLVSEAKELWDRAEAKAMEDVIAEWMDEHQTNRPPPEDIRRKRIFARTEVEREQHRLLFLSRFVARERLHNFSRQIDTLRTIAATVRQGERNAYT